MVISLAVTNAAVLYHLPDLHMEILCKAFTIDDAEREALGNNAYDVAHEFVSLYDFPASQCLMTTTVPRLCNFSLCCNEP
jgi:hypothetical protein